MKKLNADKLLEEAIEQVTSTGIEPGKINPVVGINTRAKSRFGKCSKVPYREYDYEIEINALLLEADKKKAMNTIVHEVLHTCKDCMNHGPRWKRYADIMNHKFDYDISRTNSYEQLGIERPKPRYTIVCQDCGNTFIRYKKSKLINQIQNYRCGCGGRLEVA